MKEIQNYSLIIFVVLSLISTQAQSQNNEFSKSNEKQASSELKRTTITPIKEGGYYDALQLSADEKMIVLYIHGGNGRTGEEETKTAEKYAKAFVAGFKNPKYSKCPTDIAVRFFETGKEQATVVVPITNGQEYKNPDGRLSFTPNEVKNILNDITMKHNENNNIKCK